MYHFIGSSLHECNQHRGALEDGSGASVSVKTHLDLILFTFTRKRKSSDYVLESWRPGPGGDS